MMHALILASLAAIPLEGTPTPLAGNRQVSARLSGLLPPSGTFPEPVGLRFTIRNGSRVPVILSVCPDALRVQRLARHGEDLQTVDTSVSFAMRLPSAGYETRSCKPMALPAGTTGDVDLFYRNVGLGAPGVNGNRVTLTTDGGNFMFLSSDLVAGGVARVTPYNYPDRGNVRASFPVRSPFDR